MCYNVILRSIREKRGEWRRVYISMWYVVGYCLVVNWIYRLVSLDFRRGRINGCFSWEFFYGREGEEFVL